MILLNRYQKTFGREYHEVAFGHARFIGTPVIYTDPAHLSPKRVGMQHSDHLFCMRLGIDRYWTESY